MEMCIRDRSRDTSEKLFRGDKSYLGNKSIRVYSEESARAKIFVEFVAMILRCRMYTKLKEEMKNLEKKPNYMTVPAALKELEKIEMVRQLDNVYRLDPVSYTHLILGFGLKDMDPHILPAYIRIFKMPDFTGTQTGKIHEGNDRLEAKVLD